MSTYEDLLARVVEVHGLEFEVTRGFGGITVGVVHRPPAGRQWKACGTAPDREAACEKLYNHLRDETWPTRMPGCDVCMGARVVPSDEFRDGGTAGCGDCCGGAVPDFHPSDVAVREAAARSLK